MPRYFLGVDGGQSSTTSLIADEAGRVVGVGLGGPCNQAGAIQASLDAASEEAGLNLASVHFASACLGLSGGTAGKESILVEMVSSDRTLVTDDAHIALTGATAGAPGLVVIAGTGSIAFGRNSAGRTARTGGWGYLFGDEGGAFWIARQALRAALQWEEGWGAPTSLRARLIDATGTRSMNDLLHRCYTPEFPRPRVASLAVLVNDAAERGDPAALEILDSAARELALLAVAVRAQLFQTEAQRVRRAPPNNPGTVSRRTPLCASSSEAHRPPSAAPTQRGTSELAALEASPLCASSSEEPTLVTYVGGAFSSRILLGRFREWMAPEDAVRVSQPVYGPAIGALLEAYRAAGLAIPDFQYPARPKRVP
jgi:N-acetylglucosamine kinase-like BadF-type ATPase